jgi:hypothetical protein
MLQLQIFRHENNSEIKNEQKQVQKFNIFTSFYSPIKMFSEFQSTTACGGKLYL